MLPYTQKKKKKAEQQGNTPDNVLFLRKEDYAKMSPEELKQKQKEMDEYWSGSQFKNMKGVGVE